LTTWRAQKISRQTYPSPFFSRQRAQQDTVTTKEKKISGQNTTSALKATDVIKRNKGRKFGFWKNKGKKGDPPHVFARALRAKRKKKVCNKQLIGVTINATLCTFCDLKKKCNATKDSFLGGKILFPARQVCFNGRAN
jgi:hypothetical protein